ncbi:MAG: SPOR domain-containing protein [Azoarcus sp.]|nr:SPOR domain-containing protein [Azoarcus sp.]
MSRHRRSSRERKLPSQVRGGTLLGVFVGMILGALIVAAAVFVFTRNAPFSQPASPTQTTAVEPAVVALPGKPGDSPVKEPDFTFFSTLPQGENAPVATPAPNSAAVPPPPAPPSRPPAESSAAKPIYLQLASFENAEQADDLMARLVLMGLEPVTQRAQLPDDRVVHRIRIGPFSDPEDVKAVRARLSRDGFNPVEVPAN